jgi:hypothetical protein
MRLAEGQVRPVLAGHRDHPRQADLRPEPGRPQRAMAAMLQMGKINIDAVRRAADQS